MNDSAVTSSHRGGLLMALMSVLTVAHLFAPSLAGAQQLERLKYNNPGLVVDLGVGLWAMPLPMDYDQDGDNDLVVACNDVPSNGTYFFENMSGNVAMPVFAPGRRIADGPRGARLSQTDGGVQILVPGKRYDNFRKTHFREPTAIKATMPKAVKTRANQWQLHDHNADGRTDLIIALGDWGDYGWDDGFDSQGRWLRGPLHGHVYVLINKGTNDEPTYGEPVQLQAGGKPIDVYGRPSPSFADFDGDGDADLICGEFVDSLTFFENIGTRAKPRYAPARRLSYNGEPIVMDLCMIVPVSIDWDQDGDVDLIVGEEDGRVALLENTGQVKQHMPQFLPPRHFQQQADNVKFGALVTPVSTDWDDDGDMDLVSGNTAGYIGLIENLDGGNPPRWAAPRYIEQAGKPIRIMAGTNGSIQGPCETKWGYTTLSVADWDHDGLKDLVVNSIWGKVVWYRNRGTKGKPVMEAARPITVEWKSTPPKPPWMWWRPAAGELATQWRTTPMVVDWNQDGINDLVMLDHEGYLAFFERQRQGDSLKLLPPRRVFLDEQGNTLRLNAGTSGKSGRRKLAFVDWDGDGRTDLLSNGRSIDFWQNIGGDRPTTRLQNRGQLHAHRLAGHTTTPTLVDWDRNGVPDLLIGAEDGLFYYLPNERKPAKRP